MPVLYVCLRARFSIAWGEEIHRRRSATQLVDANMQESGHFLVGDAEGCDAAADRALGMGRCAQSLALPIDRSPV